MRVFTSTPRATRRTGTLDFVSRVKTEAQRAAHSSSRLVFKPSDPKALVYSGALLLPRACSGQLSPAIFSSMRALLHGAGWAVGLCTDVAASAVDMTLMDLLVSGHRWGHHCKTVNIIYHSKGVSLCFVIHSLCVCVSIERTFQKS